MTLDLHGLAIAHETELQDDPLGAFFAAFPAAPTRVPELVVRVARGGVERPGGEPLYFLGAVQVSVDSRGFALFDGVARADVSLDGATIDARSPAPEHPWLGGLLHAALLLALRVRGWFELHAAGALLGGGAVLFVGDAGVGKTTALFSCVEHGAAFLSDDRVLLRDVERVLAYPREAHLSDATVAALRSLSDVPLVGPALHGKRRGDVRARWPERFVSSAARPRALLFPRLSGSPTSLRALPAADALGGLIEASALVAVRGVPRAAENLTLLGRLADLTPAWTLDLGREALDDPGVVARAVEEVLG